MRSGVSGGAFVLLQTVRVAARPCKATCLPSNGAHACTLALREPCLSGAMHGARARACACAHVPSKWRCAEVSRLSLSLSLGVIVCAAAVHRGTDAMRRVHAFARKSIPRERTRRKGSRQETERELALSKTPLLED